MFILVSALSTGVQAGKIYGSLQVKGKPVKEGTQIALECSGKSYEAQVKRYGRYSVRVRGEGGCSFSVAGFPGASTDVISYNDPTRYNFIIVRSGNGYSLKRR